MSDLDFLDGDRSRRPAPPRRAKGGGMAAMLGLPPVELSSGQPADLILFDFDPATTPDSEGLQLRAVLLDGEPVELTSRA